MPRPGAREDRQRVEGAGLVRDAPSGLEREAVLGADDEGVEGERGVELWRRDGAAASGAVPLRRAVLLRQENRRIHAGGLRDLERHVDAVAEDACQRLGDERAEPRRQPLRREVALRADDEAVIFVAQSDGVTQPGIVVGARDEHLELAEGGGPRGGGVDRRHDGRAPTAGEGEE